MEKVYVSYIIYSSLNALRLSAAKKGGGEIFSSRKSRAIVGQRLVGFHADLLILLIIGNMI